MLQFVKSPKKFFTNASTLSLLDGDDRGNFGHLEYSLHPWIVQPMRKRTINLLSYVRQQAVVVRTQTFVMVLVHCILLYIKLLL